jgi:hypothetical protein
MKWTLGRLQRNQWIKYSVVALTALTYNNWLLGTWLNPLLFNHNGSVSELSVSAQPHSLVFRLLDVVAGLLLVATAVLFIRQLQESKTGKFILIVTALMGVANIADAINTLPCSETLSQACQVPVSISLSHFQVPAHGYSSSVIAVCYLLLPLGGLFLAYRKRFWPLTVLSLLMVAESLASLGSALANYARHHGVTVQTSGRGQEWEMIVLAAWLIGFYFYIQRPGLNDG